MEIIDYIKSIVCIVVVLVLILRYLRASYLILNLLFIAFALRYFSIPFIGPTIDVLYLFSFAITCVEAFKFFFNKAKVEKFKTVLFFLPFVLSILYLLVYYLQSNHYLGELNPISWYFKTSANYIKSFLPFFMLGMAVKRRVDRIDSEQLFNCIFKISKFSCFLALFQLASFVFFYQYSLLLEIFGLNGGYNYQYSIGPINLVRVQAYFYEPKSFAAFLGLSIPVAYHLKKYKYALLFFIVGSLTLSQTFFVIVLACIILFVLLKKVQTIRSQIACSIIIIISIFFSVSTIKDYMLENYASQEETIAYKVFLDRALQRYSLEDVDENRELLSIPLQPDIELPAVNFLRDNSIFVITGFGPGNYNLIPFKYFTSQWNIDAIEKGTFKGHFDMGWIYLVAEFGALFFIILFLVLTQVQVKGFCGKFYSFLWLVFFFHRIDFLLVAFFSLLFYKNQNSENIHSYHIL